MKELSLKQKSEVESKPELLGINPINGLDSLKPASEPQDLEPSILDNGGVMTEIASDSSDGHDNVARLDLGEQEANIIVQDSQSPNPTQESIEIDGWSTFFVNNELTSCVRCT